MVVHQIIIDNDEKRFACLEDLYTGAGTSVRDDQVGTGDILHIGLVTLHWHSQTGLTSAREGLYW